MIPDEELEKLAAERWRGEWIEEINKYGFEDSRDLEKYLQFGPTFKAGYRAAEASMAERVFQAECKESMAAEDCVDALKRNAKLQEEVEELRNAAKKRD